MYFDTDNVDIKLLNFGDLQKAIHLNVGEDKYQLLDDGVTINNAYFLTVYKNAINIFEDLFSPSDSINLIHVIYVYNNPYKKTNIIKKFTSLTLDELPYFKEYINTNNEDYLLYSKKYSHLILDIRNEEI